MGATKFPLVPPPQGGTPSLPEPGQPGPMKPGEFGTSAKPNVVTFGFDKVGPPSTLYIQRDDQLLVTAFSSIAAEIVTLTWRQLLPFTPVPQQPSDAGTPGGVPVITPGGTIIQAVQNLAVPLAFTQAQALFQLAEGYLLGLNVSPQVAAARGRTYVRINIVRGALGGITNLQCLFADYVSGFQHGAWPGGRIIHPAESTGFLRSVTVASPAAGADWTQTVPGSSRWRVISTRAQLVTSATVANRVPELQLTDGVQSIWQGNPSASVPAGSTVAVSGSSTVPTQAANVTDIDVALPGGLVLPPTFVIQSKTLNIQAGDAWTLIRLFVEEYIDG